MKAIGVLMVILTAAGVLAVSAAGTPAPTLAHIAATPARPVAGHAFTGVTVTPVGTVIDNVICPARVRGHDLRAEKRHYYEQGAGLVAVTCTWQIPASARGTLAVSVTVETSQGWLRDARASWRIKH